MAVIYCSASITYIYTYATCIAKDPLIKRGVDFVGQMDVPPDPQKLNMANLARIQYPDKSSNHAVEIAVDLLHGFMVWLKLGWGLSLAPHHCCDDGS